MIHWPSTMHSLLMFRAKQRRRFSRTIGPSREQQQQQQQQQRHSVRQVPCIIQIGLQDAIRECEENYHKSNAISSSSDNHQVNYFFCICIRLVFKTHLWPLMTFVPIPCEDTGKPCHVPGVISAEKVLRISKNWLNWPCLRILQTFKLRFWLRIICWSSNVYRILIG